jgi:hypothetical protein
MRDRVAEEARRQQQDHGTGQHLDDAAAAHA